MNNGGRIADDFSVGKVGDKDHTAHQQEGKAAEQDRGRQIQGEKFPFLKKKIPEYLHCTISEKNIEYCKRDEIGAAQILYGQGKHNVSNQQADIIEDNSAEISPEGAAEAKKPWTSQDKNENTNSKQTQKRDYLTERCQEKEQEKNAKEEPAFFVKREGRREKACVVNKDQKRIEKTFQ